MFVRLRLATWQRLARFQITRGIVWRLPVAVSKACAFDELNY
ncbi:hypothetical protein QE197_24985 (plasmid) [Arsenophonus nasoniae]|uniref:Uncharacterized protein n=1 Tax=Arsenophonus nasoniae TaxID=638 RepID=A0ABY8NQB8_9GAMM|nr:hypothetical protein [Arsenophonus nasoniae]WGM06628.1 hypothetical protein QE258_04715 [Arsenophonus nasoniae]WGM09060.1 hypothetical protein QE258_27495 [Arsenophonus nasoniae]WGM13721.1 hypothetical protein QE197_24985 [Arsenophonus nasoniae]